MINDKYMDLIDPSKKEAYTEYKNGTLHEFAFQSHQPVLIHILNTITKGDVLEIGVGHYSTPIFHLICGKQERNLLSIETDINWASTFFPYIRSGHKVRHIERDELIKLKDPLFDKKYSIVFVDGPVAHDRQLFIKRVNADYIIVHDTQSVVTGIDDDYCYDFSTFKHIHHFTSCTPMTSVLSNLDKINNKILTVFK